MFTTKLNNNFDFTKACRLCLNQNKELISIFDISNFEIQYSIIIAECTDLMILENDNLPKIICLECVECLNKFYQFRKLVVNSERCLYDFLSKFQNDLAKEDEILNSIKKENLDIDLNEEVNTLTYPIKIETNSYILETNSEFRSKTDSVEDKLEISEIIPTFRVKIEKPEDLELENQTQIDTKLEIDENELPNTSIVPIKIEETENLENHEKHHQKIDQDNYTSSSHLLRPKKSNKRKKSFICKVCRKSFSHFPDLKNHKLIHLGEKIYNCIHCGKSFCQVSDLKKHIRIHLDDKPYICDQCGKTFNNISNLIRHTRIHTGEKPYVCKYCDKAFNVKCNLDSHERTHSGEKPFRCKHCEKSFTHASCLKNHEKIHAGERPYCCDQCGKSFVYSSRLKIHERLHRGEKPYTCKLCGKCFSDFSNFRRHEKIHIVGNLESNVSE